MDAKIKELRSQMAVAYKAMEDLQAKADAEKRNMTDEETAKWNQADKDFEKYNEEVQRREAMEQRKSQLAAPIDPQPTRRESRNAPIPTGAGQDDGDPELTKEQREERQAEKARVFTLWVREGMSSLSPEQRQLMRTLSSREKIEQRDLPKDVREARAQSVGTGSAGGFVIPQGFSGSLEEFLKAFGGMRQVARSFPTPSGNDIPWPTVDDTANVGELLAENTSAALQDVAFGQVILKAYKYSSKVVLVPIELLQDSYFPVGDLLKELLSTRIGRITNTHFTTGTGTGQPKGVVTEAGSGKVGLTGQTLSVIYDDIIDLEHAIDPLYRPNARYMMNDGSLKVVKKIKDSTGRPLWLPGLASSLSDKINGPTLNGYPYSINQDMAAMAANAKSILFGDFSKYIVRDVMDITLLRLEERYAEVGQVGFIAFNRADGRAINANALKYYQNSAT
jgi:HK97 family phage major capsid protein